MPFDLAPTTAPTPSLSPCEREALDAFVDALRGATLEEALHIAGALLDDGSWEPWMLGALLRVHRKDVVELLRRLGPLFRSTTGAR